MLLVAIATGMCWSSATAQVGIAISVIDENARPIPGAVVEVLSNGQQVASGTATATGLLNLPVPGPGTYLLKVTKQGYLASQSKLDIDRETASRSVEFVLHPAIVSQHEIEVRDSASMPTEESASVPTKVDPVQATATPIRPATLADALPLIPGVVRAKDGTVSIAALGEDHSALLVNSVNVTDPDTGEFGLSIPIDSVRSLSVAEMPYLAQYGRFTAGVVTAETRRGGDKWNFSLNDPLPEFRIRSGHLHGLRDASPRVNFSGPLIANRLYFLEGGEYLLHNQAVRTLPFPFNETRSTAVNSFTQLDAILTPKQTITATFHLAPHTLRHAGLDYFNPQPVTPDAAFHASTGTLIHRIGIGTGLLQSTFAYSAASSSIQPQGTDTMILTPLGNRGSYFAQQDRIASRYQWIERWSPSALHFQGIHNLQIGSVVSHSDSHGEFHAHSVLIQDTSARLLQRVDFSAGRTIDLSDSAPAGYVQDHWMMGNRFAMDLGMRVEGQTITHTIRSAPRIGFVWTPPKSASTVVRGGMGIFYDSVPLSIYRFRRFPDQIVTTYDGNGHVIAGPDRYVNLTDQMAASGLLFVHRSETSGNFAPYSIAWNTEIERSVNRVVKIGVKYLENRSGDMLTMRSQVVSDHNALVLSSAGSALTRQVEFTTRMGAGERKQFFFSYVRQHATGQLNDARDYLGNFPFPVVRQRWTASLPNEVPNRFLLWGTYSLPHKIQIFPHMEYRNGFPYQSTDVLQQYVASRPGPQRRFPRYFSTDIRIAKDFQILHHHAIQLSTSILNLTNHFNALEVHGNIADPQYGAFFGNYHRRVLVDFDFLY